MNGRQLVMAGLVAIALGIGLLVLGSPSLGTQVNVLPLMLTNEAFALDSPGLQLSSNVTQTVTSTVNLTGSVKVATAIAKYFGVSADSVTAMHDAGHGYGEIVKAFALARSLGNKTADDIFKLRDEKQGWGQILKSLAASKWDTSVGKLMRKSNHETIDGSAPGNSGDHRKDQKDKGNNGKNDGKSDDDQDDDKGNNGKGNLKGNNGKGKGGK